MASGYSRSTAMATTLPREMKWSQQPGAYQITVRAYALDLAATTLRPIAQVTIDDDQGQTDLDVGKAFLAKGEDSKHWLSDDAKGAQ